jgi:hypothetical protein
MNVLHPLVVGLRPPRRHDGDAPVVRGRQRHLGQRLDVDVPLLGDERLHHGLAAIAEPDGVTVRLDAVDEPQRLHVLDDLLARLEAIHPGVLAGRRRHLAVESDDGADGQAVPLADLEVDRIVARRDLDDAGAELGIDRLVRHHPHRDGAADGLDLEITADVLRVARIVGVHGQAGITELGLGPHGAERAADRT